MTESITTANNSGPSLGAGYQLSNSEIELIWSPEGLDLPTVQRDFLPSLRKWMENRKSDPLSHFLTGKSVETLDRKMILTTTADLLKRFRPQKTGIEVLRIFGKIISQGNTIGAFSLCPPPVPAFVTKKSSPFALTDWSNIGCAQTLRDLLESSIRAPITLTRKKTSKRGVALIALGQLLVSAIVYGGLINRFSLEALVHQLRFNGDAALQCQGDRVYAELSLSWRSQADAEFRRWFLDHLSAALLLDMSPDIVKLVVPEHQDSPKYSLKKYIWQAISAFIKHAGGKVKAIAPTLPKLLSAVRVDLATQLHIDLVNYAARDFVSHSLKPHAWQRLYGIPASGLASIADQERSPKLSPPGSGIQADVKDTFDLEPRWLSALRKAMQGEDRLSIIDRLRRLLDQANDDFAQETIGEYFGRFALRLFTIHNDNHSRLAVRTARAYTISAAKRLGGLIGNSIADFDSDEWIGLYAEALSDAENPSIRRKLIRVLREFQRYRELDRDEPPIEAAEVFGTSDGLVPVDANIISHDEFLQIREQFILRVADSVDADLAEIGWLILTLSYRCGLRRMEVLKLELNDLLLQEAAELLVRPTESRRLKTKSSTRKSPIHALLEATELERLQKWLTKRSRQEAESPYSKYLFSAPHRDFKFIPQDTLFRMLHEVMRDVTGDHTLRFHHLRHTFASRTFIGLFASRLQKASRLAIDLPGSLPIFQDASSSRQRLYGNQYPTRRDIWAVSSLLGHSGPDVSLEHYIHLMDIALAENLVAAGVTPPNSLVILASNQSADQAYRYLREHNSLSPWIARLWQKKHSEKAPKKKEIPRIQQAISVQKNSGKNGKETGAPPVESVNRMWRLLLIHATKKRSAAELSERTGLSEQRIQQFIDNAHWLSELKLKGNKSFRHRFKTWTPDKRFPHNHQRIICPNKPNSPDDQKIIDMMASKFRTATKQNRELAEKVLETFAQKSRPDFSGMIFTDPNQPNEAKEFIQWLKTLGFTKKNIRLVTFDVTTQRSPVAAQWKRALGIRSAEHVEKIAPPNGRVDWASRWLGVRPIFTNERGSTEGSAAFRFLMIMAIIGLRNRSLPKSRPVS